MKFKDRLLQAGIALAREKFKAERITIGAQGYARSLYEKTGFIPSSGEYLEAIGTETAVTGSCSTQS